MNGPLTVPLAGASGPDSAGGKGASLGDLARAGIPVPPGFVVTAATFAGALDAVDPSGGLRSGIEALPARDLPLISRTAARFREMIAAVPLPATVALAITDAYAALGAAEVAVRSSATMEDSAAASFAGLQDTYLGVLGPGNVLDAVRRCWASLYNDESVAYRRRIGLTEQGLSMAVVVQRMVSPRAAGVMFTRSPVTGDRSVVAIEGTWGLGSALVAGDVTPDSFVISKITGEITARRISPKTKIHKSIINGPVPGLAGPSGSPAQAGRAAGTPAGHPAAPEESEADHPAGTTRREPAPPGQHGPGVSVEDMPSDLRDKPCLWDGEIRALAAFAGRVEEHYGIPQDIEWAILDEPVTPARAASPGPEGRGEPGGAKEPGGKGAAPVPAAAASAPEGPGFPEAPPADRIVLLQARPETVWAARDAHAATPVAAPKPRPADHVLALFGKPL